MTEQQVGASFVGRERELRELEALLDESRLGRGHLALLGGEPGIGKSRLADELANRARELGHTVLWGRGWEDAGAPPYWPWVQVLRAYLRAFPADDVRRHLGFGARDVAQILPELRELIPDLESPADQASESARFQLFDSTATLLRNAARDRPMVVVIDDLQAADTPSILLLHFLASQLSDMSTLVVGTYRDVELTPVHPLTSAIAELAREPATRVMTLGGLAPDAVGEFIGVTANVSATGHLAAAVWRATGGNPLFVVEAVRLLSAEGRLADVADLPSLRLAVPAGVRAVIARRIGHLDAATAQALRLGAAIGPEFSLEVLRRVGGFEIDQGRDLVDEALLAGLLTPVTGVAGRYRFSHDLVRETLYDDLSSGRRAGVHQRIAEVLEERYGSSIGGHLAELAFHFVQAAQQEQDGSTQADVDRVRRKAIEYSIQAADAAARSIAFEEAAKLYRMTLAVIDLADAPDDESRAETLLGLGDAQARAGSLDDAQATFQEAAAIARRLGNGRQLARAALGSGGRHFWARPGKDTKLIPLLQDALVLLGGGDERLRLRLLTRLACAWRSTPERRDDSAALSQQAIDIARRLDDPLSLSYALTGRFWATWWPENPAERQAIANEVMGIAEAVGDGERTADAHFMVFLTLTERGRMAEAGDEMDTLSRAVAELRQPPHLWLEPVNRAELALVSGDFSEAERLIAWEQASTYRITPGRDDVSAARMHRFLLRREQGRVAEEEATVRASCVEFPWYPFHRAALACLLFDVGRTAEAQAVMDGLARDGFAALYRDNEWLLGMSLTSEACALLRDAQAAENLYGQLLPFAGRHAIGHAEGSVGAVDRYLGLLAATRGDLDSAVRHLEDAVGVNEEMGARPWAAHSRHDLADVLRRRGSRGDQVAADRHDRAAHLVATELGMALAEQIRAVDYLEPAATATTMRSSATFVREGEYWSIEFGEDAFRVRDSKGMRHLARLVGSPGREVHALDLAGSDTPADMKAQSADPDLPIDSFGDIGAILDPEAKAAYRMRLTEIREELAEAERWNDPERVLRLQDEERALTQELAGALGLGGRDRVAGSAAERARVSVTRAIRAAMVRVREQSTALGDHLDATIRTGTFCSYAPDPRAPISWRT